MAGVPLARPCSECRDPGLRGFFPKRNGGFESSNETRCESDSLATGRADPQVQGEPRRSLLSIWA
jgi:hypothetical protein